MDALEDKKAEDIVLLDIREVTDFTDYFVICSGTSDRQLKALVDSTEETAKAKFSVNPRSVEGRAESGWVLVDFGDVVVHAFTEELREFYGLEELWQRGRMVVRIK